VLEVDLDVLALADATHGGDEADAGVGLDHESLLVDQLAAFARLTRDCTAVTRSPFSSISTSYCSSSHRATVVRRPTARRGRGMRRVARYTRLRLEPGAPPRPRSPSGGAPNAHTARAFVGAGTNRARP